jgi:hypothetical protein
MAHGQKGCETKLPLPGVVVKNPKNGRQIETGLGQFILQQPI